MEAVELDQALDDLETRVERLRALYEQYFMGIEKIPPHVVQKDVDRRLYILRREQIRNTARRFKLQTIVQRYNTFQQYWLRIMREIENGTYRRHVLRAEKTVGIANLLTASERKRLGLAEAPETTESRETTAGTTELAENAVESSTATAPQPPVERDQVPENSAAIRLQIERDLGLALGDETDELFGLGKLAVGKELDDPLLSSLPPAPLSRESDRSQQHRYAAAAFKTPLSSKTEATHPSPAVAPREPLGGQQGLRLPAQSAVVGRGLPPPRSAVAGRGLPPPQSAMIGRGLPPKELAGARTKPSPPPSVESPAAPKAPSPIAVVPTSIPATAARSTNAEPPSPPNVAAPMANPDAPRPANGSAAHAQSPAPPPPSRPRGLPDVRDSVIPSSVRPPASPKATERRGPVSTLGQHEPSSVNDAKRDKGLVDPMRIQTIADKLTALRAQTNESKSVSVSALTKKLEATSAELRQKHPGKRIDFDVVIKDGKAIVKPIVR